MAGVTVLTLELVRASGPLLDRALATSPLHAGLAALATYAAAGVVVALLLLTTGRGHPGTPSATTVRTGVVALALARLVLQALHGAPRFAWGLATVAIAVAVACLMVTFVAGRSSGARQAALGIALGGALSTGLQLALGTWDALWRTEAGTPGAVGWLVAVGTTGCAVLTARGLRRDEPGGRARRGWGVGPGLALVAMVLANPAFVAAQTGLRLDVAGATIVLGWLAGGWVLLTPHRLLPPVRVAAAAGLPLGVAAAAWSGGPLSLAGVVIAQVGLAVVMVTTCGARRPALPGWPRAALAAAVAGLGLVLPLLAYLVDDRGLLGIDNALVVLAAAVVVAGTGLRLGPPEPAMDATDELPARRVNAVRLLALPALALVAVGWWQTRPVTVVPEATAGPRLTVLTWNLHHGVAPGTAVDLDGVARTIEAADPDVVTLQEVSRGWPPGGGTDMATWLGRRLGMTVSYAPAADRQIGTAILSRSALTDVAPIGLPAAAERAQDCALGATVTLSGGTPVRVSTARLRPRGPGATSAPDEVGVLVADLPDVGAQVLTGDLGAPPGGPERAALTAAGWISAAPVDDPGGATSRTGADSVAGQPGSVLGRGVGSVAVRVLDVRQTWHLPVVAVVSPRP